jgi:hypothetical protein
MNESRDPWREYLRRRNLALFAFSLTLVLLARVVDAQGKTPAGRRGPEETMCGLGTYHDALDLAFNNANIGAGETLVTVQVLPSFQREYAFVLRRDDAGQVKLLRVTLHDQLWSQLMPLHVSRTRQQCLEIARASKVDSLELSTPSEAMKLWTAFRNINLDTDTCARLLNGVCAIYLDGTAYVVETNDGRSLWLTETGDAKNVKNQNPVLLEWVHALRQMAKNPTPQ